MLKFMRSERVAARVTARACPFDSCTDSRHQDVPVTVAGIAEVAEVAEAVVCRPGVADECAVSCGRVLVVSSSWRSPALLYRWLFGPRGGPLLAVLFSSPCRSGSAYPGAAAAVRLYR